MVILSPKTRSSANAPSCGIAGPLPVMGPWSGRIAPLALGWAEDRDDIGLFSIVGGGLSQRQIDALDPACGRLGLALGLAVVLAAALALAG